MPREPRHEPSSASGVRDAWERLPAPVIVIGADGRVQSVNGAACELLGRSRRRSQGRTLPDLGLGAIADRLGHRLLGALELPDGREVQFSLGAPAHDGAQTLVLLARPAAGLERNQRLLGSQRQLMAALVAGLAHEIRNPLGGIRGAAQLIGRGADPVEQRELSRLIVGASDRIGELVRRWVELTEPLPADCAVVDLNRLVHQEVRLLGAELGASGRALEVELDLDPSLPGCRGEEASLQQALHNLLRNARGTRLSVRTRLGARRHVERGRSLRVEIEDDGPGVEPALVGRIFDPFVSGAGGAGMGLFVARQAVARHGGSLRYRPARPLAEPPGALFELTLWERQG